MSHIDGEQITSVGPAHGLADDPVNTVAEDRDGNLWIGTDASGALRIAAFGLVSYFEADGLRNDFVPFLFEGDQERVIAVSASLHHQRIRRPSLREDQVQRSAARAGHRFVHCPSRSPGRLVARDADRPVSIPGHWRTRGRGARHARRPLCRDRGAAERRFVPALRRPPRRHLADCPITGSHQARSLASCVRRLPAIRGNGGPWRNHVRLDGLASGDRREPAGELFFGFRDAGLFAYRDGRFESILDRGKPFVVISLHLDHQGRLWIVGPDGSVSRLDNLSTGRLTTDTKVTRRLTGANVRCMVEDASGHFFFGTMSGVIEVDPASGDTWRYTTAEGLAQNEVWSALASRRGDLWFGTIAGVSRLDSARSRPRTLAPRALIRTVRVNGAPHLVSELGTGEIPGLTLAPSERGIAIEFFALAFGSASACDTSIGSKAPKTRGALRRRFAASTTRTSHRVPIASRSAP